MTFKLLSHALSPLVSSALNCRCSYVPCLLFELSHTDEKYTPKHEDIWCTRGTYFLGISRRESWELLLEYGILSIGYKKLFIM